MTVVLDPGIEAGLSHGLYQAPGRLVDLVNGFGEQAQVGFVVNALGSHQENVIVITRKPFKEPQQLGVILTGVVIACEFRGAQAFDVPGVEVFMADQPQQPCVPFIGLCRCRSVRHSIGQARQVFARADQRSGIAVFQATVTIVDRIEHKDVVGVRRFAFAVPKANFRLTDLLGVCQ